MIQTVWNQLLGNEYLAREERPLSTPDTVSHLFLLSVGQEVRSEQFSTHDNLPVHRHSAERTTCILPLFGQFTASSGSAPPHLGHSHALSFCAISSIAGMSIATSSPDICILHFAPRMSGLPVMVICTTALFLTEYPDLWDTGDHSGRRTQR